MKYLFVVAHPDDEILGAGALIYTLIKEGHEVYVFITNGKNIFSRKNISDDMSKSHEIIGVQNVSVFDFENLELSKVKVLDIVPKIENIIMTFKPDYIFTHWELDINPDHRAVADYTKQAAKYTQRKICDFSIKGLYAMEILSSTEWGTQFIPDTYISVKKDAINAKIQSLKVYDNVLRHDTHPRSERVIVAKAIVRGSECGVEYAEAFKTYWRIKDV